MTRPRDAPMARRTAISRSRREPRASSKFAAFTHARARTTTGIGSTIADVKYEYSGRVLQTRLTSALAGDAGAPRVAASRAATTSDSARTCASATPWCSRPTKDRLSSSAHAVTRQHTNRQPTREATRLARDRQPHVDTSKERRGNANDLNVNPSDAQ